MNPLTSQCVSRARLVLLWTSWLVFLLPACGGPPAELELAERQFRRGDLNAASLTLESLGVVDASSAQRVRSLRAEIESLVTSRAELASALAGTRSIHPREAQAELERLLSNCEDDWARDQVILELSKLADRLAEGDWPEPRPQPKPTLDAPQEASAQVPAELSPAQLAQQRAAEARELERMQRAIAIAASIGAATVEPDLAQPELTPQFVPAELPSEIHLPQRLELAPEVTERLQTSLDYAAYELEEAHAQDRERAAEILRGIYPGSTYFLRQALRVRWDRACAALEASAELAQLTELHERYLELESRRAVALALIFDGEAYFYPYAVPECPAEKARTYGTVQRQVDVQVQALEQAWLDSSSHVLSKEFHWWVDELVWQRIYGQDHDHFPSLPGKLRGWIFWLGEPGQELTVRNFTANRSGRLTQAYNRAVEAYNRRWWGENGMGGLSEEARATPDEQGQVQVTNDYRRLFGLRILAWNPQLQEAARSQAAYMAKVGHITHTQEDDPTRRSPFDRMALVGYNYGASENCSEGYILPQSVLKSWRKSSAHHRNLLISEHTELGSARIGTFWTQNFGTGREFHSELDSWQD